MLRNETRLAVEQVEDRMLLAAVVDAAGGDVGILGDQGIVASDQIIAFTNGAGDIVVLSRFAGLSTTTPGNVTVGILGFRAVIDGDALTDDFKVISGNSFDFIGLFNIAAPDDLTVDLDAGPDILVMFGNSGDEAVLNGGAGNNFLFFNANNNFNSGDTTNFNNI